MIFCSPNNEILVDLQFMLHNSGKFYDRGSTNLKRPFNCPLLEDVYRVAGRSVFESELNSDQCRFEVRPVPHNGSSRSFKIEFQINPKALVLIS